MTPGPHQSVAIVAPLPSAETFTILAEGATFATGLASATKNRTWELDDATNCANIPRNPNRAFLVIDATQSTAVAKVYYNQATSNTPDTTLPHRYVPAATCLELPFPLCTRNAIIVQLAGATAGKVVVTEFSHGNI